MTPLGGSAALERLCAADWAAVGGLGGFIGWLAPLELLYGAGRISLELEGWALAARTTGGAREGRVADWLYWLGMGWAY